MRAYAPAPMPSPCGLRQATGEQLRRSCLPRMDRRRRGPTRAGPLSCSVMLDGAYVRAVPGHQVRNFEAICGKVEQEGHSSRRFALVRSVAEQPHGLLRAALREQGWRERKPVTAISDGDPALPALVRSATGGPVEHILDWFHLSMQVRHVELALLGLYALKPTHRGPLEHAQSDGERLRHLLWNGYHEEVCEALGRIASGAEDAARLNGAAVEAKAGRLVARCTELRAYIENNDGALIDYGQRYRAGKPISTSRAEGTVNHLVNARMNKRRQMRWSPRGAHRVLQVRAAVLDGRLGLGQQAIQLAAWRPRFLPLPSARHPHVVPASATGVPCTGRDALRRHIRDHGANLPADERPRPLALGQSLV